MSGLDALGEALPFVGDLISMPFKIHESRQNRRQNERDLRFQRLMSLMKQGDAMQTNNASAGRLMALRNSGSM